jgi:putative ABC transport system ATP-binding protein
LIALRGRSGSGKTTLLNILTGLDNPTAGRVRIAGQDLAPLNETARALLRRQYVGVMFQNAHLFPVLTAQENVEVPLRLGHVTSANERSERARRALELVGLLPRAEHRGMELSGGEQQRAALARALVTSPRFLVADEPTGNLDSQTGRAIAALLREVAHGEGIGMLIATHDATIAATADRVLQLRDGALSDV